MNCQKGQKSDLRFSTNLRNPRFDLRRDYFDTFIPGSLWSNVHLRKPRSTQAHLQHERHELAAAGHFEFAENCMKMLFYHWQTQARDVGDLLIALSVAHKAGNFLLPSREPGEMWQTRSRGRRPELTTRIRALDKKMWLRHRRVELF